MWRYWHFGQFWPPNGWFSSESFLRVDRVAGDFRPPGWVEVREGQGTAAVLSHET